MLKGSSLAFGRTRKCGFKESPGREDWRGVVQNVLKGLGRAITDQLGVNWLAA